MEAQVLPAPSPEIMPRSPALLPLRHIRETFDVGRRHGPTAETLQLFRARPAIVGHAVKVVFDWCVVEDGSACADATNKLRRSETRSEFSVQPCPFAHHVRQRGAVPAALRVPCSAFKGVVRVGWGGRIGRNDVSVTPRKPAPGEPEGMAPPEMN
jgi:hypothetical protein